MIRIPKDELEVKDELNLYLVISGFKPATMIDFDPITLISSGLEFVTEVIGEYKGTASFRVKKEHEENIRQFMEGLGVKFDIKEERYYQAIVEEDGTEHDISNYGYKVTLGKNQQSLERLLGAKTDQAIGLAYGYPLSAVKAFGKLIDCERRDGTYYKVNLGKAKQSGIEIPTWLAYISHVPEQLDLVGSNISESSKRLGERYQRYVRKTNPDLAARVEATLQEGIPSGWDKTEDGSYILNFEAEDLGYSVLKVGQQKTI